MNAPEKIHFTRKQRFEAGKLEKRLCRLAGEAIGDYGMIQAGDRVMVCLSGGKDSYGLLDVLLKLRGRSPVSFDLIAVNLDQRHPGYPERVLPDYLDSLGVPYRILEKRLQDVVAVVAERDLGRAYLARDPIEDAAAQPRAQPAHRLAVGDDALHHGIGILHLDAVGNAERVEVVGQHPLGNQPEETERTFHAYVAETDLEAYARVRGFPIIPCDLCGSQPTLQRKQVKEMLREWEKRHPGRVESMFRALSDLVPSHLMDRKLFDFAAVRATGKTSGDGDKAFD